MINFYVWFVGVIVILFEKPQSHYKFITFVVDEICYDVSYQCHIFMHSNFLSLLKGDALYMNLVEASRLFAASLVDIPAHRREKIMQALAFVTPSKYAWIIVAVWFENYCATWQRKNDPKGEHNMFF